MVIHTRRHPTAQGILYMRCYAFSTKSAIIECRVVYFICFVYYVILECLSFAFSPFNHVCVIMGVI